MGASLILEQRFGFPKRPVSAFAWASGRTSCCPSSVLLKMVPLVCFAGMKKERVLSAKRKDTAEPYVPSQPVAVVKSPVARSMSAGSLLQEEEARISSSKNALSSPLWENSSLLVRRKGVRGLSSFLPRVLVVSRDLISKAHHTFHSEGGSL